MPTTVPTTGAEAIPRHRDRRGRRVATTAGLLALVVFATSACLGTWGIRTSYRHYVTSAAAQGAISTEGGVTWLDGPGTGRGPFRWSVNWATFDGVTETGTVQMTGGVHTQGHPTADGFILDLSVWNPRLEIAGDTGTLVADLNYRPFEGFTPGELAPLEAALDVPFATVDLSGVDWTPNPDGLISISDAPMVGITAAMEMIGWDQFYGDPVALDPLSVNFNPTVLVPTLAPAPEITVSKTTDLEIGDTITVWGTGFDPTANIGTRPPFAGQPAGVYAVLGRFVDPWQPSTGAPSANRTVIDQRWALPAASRAVLDPAGVNPAFATIDAFGRFETTIVVDDAVASGDLGIYVYPGSGAVDPAHELAVPVSLAS